MRALLEFWVAHRAELLVLIRQHVVLVMVSTLAAVSSSRAVR